MPITRDELFRVVGVSLELATEEQRALFDRYRTEPALTVILNDDRHSEVWVVAMNGDQVTWYDDVEDGFNVSTLSNGVITEPGYEQDLLGTAISRSWRDAAN